jgi:hypothetical protein
MLIITDKFKIVVLSPGSDADPTWDMAEGTEIWEVEYPPNGEVDTVHDFIVHSKVKVK